MPQVRQAPVSYTHLDVYKRQLLGITKRSSAPLSGISERSSGLPETLSLESASPREPASPLRLARSDDSGFHGSDLRPLLRRAAAICGIVLFMIGGLGLLALWTLSEMYPVQLTDWDGSRHTGLWGFLLAHEIRSLFWLASGLLASGGVLAVGAVSYTHLDDARRVPPHRSHGP